jgi:ubiquinone/menaquinone biosynthesis C-methylase UbiE
LHTAKTNAVRFNTLKDTHRMDKKPIGAGKSSFDLIRPDLLFPAIQLQENTVLLDVACGVGNYSLAAAEFIGRQGAILALDLWPDGIAQLQQAAARQGFTQIKAMVADVSSRMPVADDQADICLLATVLHDLKEVEAHESTLTEIARVLRPQGRLAVIEFKKIAGPPGPPLGIRLSPEQVEGLVQPHGFRKIRQLDLGPHTYLILFQLT